MCRRILSTVAIICLVHFMTGNIHAKPGTKQIEKVKAGIIGLGVGPDAVVEVKLNDKTKLKGYVSEATEDHFVITNRTTGEKTTVQYGQVKQVKGNNLSAGAKIAIGVGVVALLVLFAFAVSEKPAGP